MTSTFSKKQFKTALSTMLILVVLSCALLFNDNSNIAKCFVNNYSQHGFSAQSNCANTYMANQSWLVWLTGGSKSAYFHYLDLIELLNPRK